MLLRLRFDSFLASVRLILSQFDPSVQWRARVFLICLVGGDILFIGIHVLIHGMRYFGVEHGIANIETFYLHSDRSFPEIFGYIKLIFTVIVLIGTYFHSRALCYIVFALIFAFALIDDAFRLHEQTGAYLANSHLGPPYIVETVNYHVGQMLFFFTIASFFALILLAVWWRTDGAHRPWFIVFTAILFGLGFFAAFVDAVKIAIYPTSVVWHLATIAEDGGEMLVLSLLCWVSIIAFKYNKLHSGC